MTEATTLTGFAIGRKVNEILKAEGLKEIPTQMVYRYMGQKLIPTVTVNGQKRVREADANTWIAKYVAGRKAKAAAPAATPEPVAV